MKILDLHINRYVFSPNNHDAFMLFGLYRQRIDEDNVAGVMFFSEYCVTSNDRVMVRYKHYTNSFSFALDK